MKALICFGVLLAILGGHYWWTRPVPAPVLPAASVEAGVELAPNIDRSEVLAPPAALPVIPLVVPLPPVPAPARVVPGFARTIPKTPPRTNAKFHRVLKGGGVGVTVECKQAAAVAKNYSNEIVQAYARQYGLSEAEIKKLSVCLK